MRRGRLKRNVVGKRAFRLKHDKTIMGLIISGAKSISNMPDDELLRFDSWVNDYIKQLEVTHGRRFTQKERDRLYKLIAGIMKKFGEYDERYHLYLLGRVIGE